MGDNTEERLVKFHQWIEEVNDKMRVANVSDEKLQTTIALMWGGKDIKEYASNKAGVILHDDDTGTEAIHSDTWTAVAAKIKTVHGGG